ncbi:alpha/beta fold hydrolase [Streptomyces sp. NPDC002589]|uniref:alpha/beta fold hydrolase n=1 Tax=Streptomyces sp. NPDC002589 TaxID=3154420 RepID=UPI00331C9A44
MCGTPESDCREADARTVVRLLMPAPHGPLAGVEVRRPGPSGPHWDGSRVALVSGAGGAKEDFLPLMHRLVEAGHRLFAVDLCGQNETPGPDDPAAYGIDAQATDLAVAMTAVCARKPVHLVGHGAGALVAATAVLQARSRERFAPSTYGSLTLVAPCWDAPLTAGDVASADWEPLVARQHRGGTLTDERRALIRQRLARSHPMSMEHLAAAAAAPDLVAALRADGIRMLVVGGAEDPLVPVDRTRELARHLGARHSVVPGAGHLPHHDNPDALAAALTAFWAEDEVRSSRPPAAHQAAAT